MLNEDELKLKLEEELQSEDKMSAILILTVISITLDIFLFMYKNCNMKKALIKNSAKKKGFLFRKFIKNHVIPSCESKNLNQEETELAIEKIRDLIATDKLDKFLKDI